MKPVISIAAAAALGFVACSEPSSTQDNAVISQPHEEAAPPADIVTDAVSDARTLQIALAPYEIPAQHIPLVLDKPKDITGAGGTVIRIDPADLETEDGSPAGKNAELTLIELTDKTEMLRNNMQTESNGTLLVSGGAYYIECSAGGHKLHLKPGKTIAVSFPKNSKESMQLFYGNKDSMGNMNWQPSNTALRVSYKTDSVMERIPVVSAHDSVTNAGDFDKDAAFGLRVENGQTRIAKIKKQRVSDTQYILRRVDAGKRVEDQLYAQVKLSKMGWINCDRPYDAPEVTEMLVYTPAVYRGKLVRMYIVFKRWNSVLTRQFYPRNDNSGNTLYGLPVNEPVRIIAFTVAGGLHAFSQDVILQHNIINIDLKPATDADIKKLILPRRG